jgi:hypothetical protein
MYTNTSQRATPKKNVAVRRDALPVITTRVE